MEEINRLLNYKDLKIVQNTDWFKFSIDSVLLSNFVKITKNTTNIIDFCTGNAPIPLILSKKTRANITGVEIQKDVYNLAKKSIEINNLQDRIEILNMDVKDIAQKYESDSFDLITCNPPYFKLKESSIINDNDIKSVARHEIYINLDDIFKVARKILKNNGTIAIVHRTDRLIDIIDCMKKNNIEPKRLQLVYPKFNKESNIVLIEGAKNGKSSLKVLPPIYVHDEDGNYLEEIKKMFEEE